MNFDRHPRDPFIDWFANEGRRERTGWWEIVLSSSVMYASSVKQRRELRRANCCNQATNATKFIRPREPWVEDRSEWHLIMWRETFVTDPRRDKCVLNCYGINRFNCTSSRRAFFVLSRRSFGGKSSCVVFDEINVSICEKVFLISIFFFLLLLVCPLPCTVFQRLTRWNLELHILFFFFY